MARPERNNVDYFPHSVNHGRKMFFIENKYGNDGYAVWFKVLELLGKAEMHYLDIQDKVQQMFLSSYCRVSDDMLKIILKDLVDLGEFDAFLYDQGILYNPSFVLSIDDAYSRRTNKCITFEGLCMHLTGLCRLNVDIKPQSKVEYSKVDKSRGDYKQPQLGFVPPTLLELKAFFKEKEYAESRAVQAFNHYEASDWKNAAGHKLTNWKQSMVNNWFKPEFKIVVPRLTPSRKI